MPRPAHIFLLLAALFAIVPTAHAGQLNDSSLGLSLQVPDDFKPSKILVDLFPKLKYAYLRQESEGGYIAFAIAPLDDKTAPGTLHPKVVPGVFTGRFFTMRWQGRDVDAVEESVYIANKSMDLIVVEVPLFREPVRIGVAGDYSDRDHVLKTAQNLLDHLQATSWFDYLFPSGLDPASSLDYSYLTLFILAFLAGLVALWYIRTRTTKRVHLFVPAFLYAISWLITADQSPELNLLIGFLRLFGFLTFILGSFDLFRFPQLKPAPAPQNQLNW